MQYTPARDSSPDIVVQIPAIRIWNKRIGRKGRSGGTRKSAMILEAQPSEPTASAPTEDLTAEDASDWVDVLDDDIQVKSKRAKRNDSVSV